MSQRATSLALQWNLDVTVGSSVKIAAGVLHAATSDNVQPLAIMACEAFGANLAMSTETCLKMEKLAKRKHTSHVLKYLKIQIGYSAGDTADYLASSEAGVRFLALADILLRAFEDTFQAAQALHKILLLSAPNKQLLPTIRQIKDLLGAVSYKLTHSGLGDQVLGWQVMLAEKMKSTFDDRYKCHEIYAPSSLSIMDFIRAMAELERLGEVTSILIKTQPGYFAWLISLVKWCSGVPPNILLVPKGISVFQQAASRVTLEVGTDCKPFEIQTFKRLNDIEQLLWASVREPHSFGSHIGAVTASQYFSNRLNDFILGGCPAGDIWGCLLDMACKLPDRFKTNAEWLPDSRHPFPESKKVVDLVLRLFPQQYSRRNEGTSGSHEDKNLIHLRRQCMPLLMEILVFSLLDDSGLPDGVLVTPFRHDEVWRMMRKSVENVHKDIDWVASRPLYLEAAPIETAVLALLGHCARADQPHIVATGNGQVSYRYHLESIGLEKHGILQRRVHSGSLRFEDQTYRYATGRDISNILNENLRTEGRVPDGTLRTTPLTISVDDSPPFDPWCVAASDEHLVMDFGGQHALLTSVNDVVEAASAVCILDHCFPSCPKAEDFRSEILYCNRYDAALLKAPAHLRSKIRVLDCNGDRSKSLVMTCVIGSYVRRQTLDPSPTADYADYPSVAAYYQRRACLWCTCKAALRVLNSPPGHMRDHVVVIATDPIVI